MSKKRKQKGTLNVVGEREYNFNFQLEKNIHSNLCCIRVKRKVFKNLNKENLNFYTYKAWKQYVYNRYENYKSEQLFEFSRYLNQRIRNTEPDGEYWQLSIPVILTLIFTNMFNFLLDTKWDYSDSPIFDAIFVTIIIEIIVVVPLVILILIIMKPMRDNITDRNFLTDYKEIIDDMIKEKNSNKKKINCKKSNTNHQYSIKEYWW